MRLAALVLVVLLAGCASPSPAKTTPPAASGGPSFAATDLGAGGPEPVLRVAPEGAILVAAQDPQGGGPRVWISKDGARSFDVSRPTTQGGGEVDMAVGPGGVVYVTQLGTSGNVVSVSRDSGATWTTSPLGAQTTYFDREWLGVDERGSAYVVARPKGDNTVSQVSRSDDKGLTFVPQGAPWDAAREPGLTNGNLAFSARGIAMPYVCRDGSGVCVARSQDRGATWSRALVAEGAESKSHVYATLGVTAQGFVVAWSEPVGGRLAVFESVSTDGESWSAPKRLSPASESALAPWVATDERSGGWIVWLSTPTAVTSGDDAAAARAEWSLQGVPIDARGAPQRGSDALSGTVHVGAVSPPIARGGAAPYNRLFGDFFTAALDAKGKLLVAAEKDFGLGGASHVVVLREGS